MINYKRAKRHKLNFVTFVNITWNLHNMTAKEEVLMIKPVEMFNFDRNNPTEHILLKQNKNYIKTVSYQMLRGLKY